MNGMNRSYDKEFKLNAVQLIEKSGKTIRQMVSDLDILLSTLRQWTKSYENEENHSFRGKGVISSSNEEIFNLKRLLQNQQKGRYSL